jgi:hypothetical protein
MPLTDTAIRNALAVGLPPRYDAVLGLPLGNGLNIQNIISYVARHYLNRAIQESHGNKTEAPRLVGLELTLDFRIPTVT